MAGRLIRPSLVKILQIDTLATAADPGVIGLSSGYRTGFGEPANLEDADGNIQNLKVTRDPICIPAQVEVTKASRLQAAAVGFDRSSLYTLVFHFDDLYALGLVETEGPAKGEARIRAGDQLIAIGDIDGNFFQTLREPLFAIEPRSYAVGLGGDRNLHVVEFQSRDIGQQTA